MRTSITITPRDKTVKNQRGFSLTELIAVVIIMGILASVAMPLAKNSVIRAKEIELRRSLREMRRAIDLYKKMADEKKIDVNPTDSGYPEIFKSLVEGVELAGKDIKFKFLRRIPRDPFTGDREWGMRSSQDDSDSDSWGGEDVFDIYSLSEGAAMDGTEYREW